MESEKKVLTPIEVAKKLGCCRKTIYSMLKANEIPHVKIGDMYMIPVSAFEKWLMECGKNQVAKSQ
jgi:excisionase family DNA binding protein